MTGLKLVRSIETSWAELKLTSASVTSAKYYDTLETQFNNRVKQPETDTLSSCVCKPVCVSPACILSRRTHFSRFSLCFSAACALIWFSRGIAGEINSDQRAQLFLMPLDDASGLFTLQSEHKYSCGADFNSSRPEPRRQIAALFLAAEALGSRRCENNQLSTSDPGSLRPRSDTDNWTGFIRRAHGLMTGNHPYCMYFRLVFLAPISQRSSIKGNDWRYELLKNESKWKRSNKTSSLQFLQ